MRAQSSLLRELATAVAQLTARDRVVDGEGAHGSDSGQRFARQPTGSGGAAERPDLLELAQSGRVGAKSVSAEDDYLAVPELLQRAESGYEAVRPVSRVPGLFPLSTDLTNEYLKQDDRRLPAQEEYLWMSCFGAHMAALFVALDELLPYVPATNQDFTPYLARARNHAEAIDKAFRFRLAFLRKLNEIKRVHAPRRPLLLEWRLQLQVAGVGEDVAADVDVAAKDAFGSDELGQRTLDLLSSSLSAQTLKSYAGRLAQFAEFCHDSENISPLEATTATVVRYVAWIGERGHIAAKSLQPYLSAINTFFELHNLVPIAKDSLHLTSARRQRFARQPTGSGGAAERPDLLELAQSGRVGAKSVSAEDDYLAVPELLQRAESGYEAVRPVSRVPGLFPLSTDLTNEYLKQDDRRLPAQEEYLWMSCFGAHMAALFVALDELLPYVPATNQDFTPYLARARNHAEAIDKAFRFRLAFLRKLNEIKRVHAPRRPLLLEWRLQLQVAGVGEDVAADVDVAAKDAFGSDELGQRTLDLLSSSLSAQTLKSYAGRLAQFAEFCHDSENISPLEATTATVVRYVAWIGERGHIAAKSLQPYLSAINTFFELHNLVPIAKDSLHLTSARRQRFARQPTGSGGAAERPDLLELAQSGRVGAKSVSAEDDYLAVPELLQRAESGYEAVRPVSRVPGLFPLSTDLTNEYLKQDDRRLPAQEEYLWMSCFGAHMAALFVALDELLPYVPATNQDFTPYLARARNHAEAIDKAFRFRLAFLRKLNEIKRVHAPRRPLLLEWRLQLQVAGVGEDVAADVDVAAKDAFGSDELGQRTLDLLSSSLSAQTLKSYAGRLAQFAEFCHDSENISPLEATTATVVRYVAWIGERGHIAAKSLQPYLSAINTFFELHNLVPIAKDSLHLTSARRQRFARQPTGSGGAAERPDLLELAQSGRVGAKSVSAEDDYLAVPELLQRAESGYEAVRPVSRVPGLFPLSTDLTNEYLKQDDRRLPAQEEYLWMSCFGAHMAALFVALDELLPYVPATNQDFTPYLARARNHAEAIDKAFRFRLAFLRKLNEIKRVHAPRRPLLLEWRLQLQVAGVGEDVAADVDVAAKTLKSYAGRLAQFAEFCHDSENISPLEATTATVVRYVAWIGERGHIAAKSLQPYLSAINTFFELHNLVPIAKDSLHLTSARRQRFAGQPTGSGGAAERPDLLELAQSGRVGAKSVSAEDDYLAVPELLQRAESGYEAVRPVSRVPGLFPLSTDLTNEYLKQDDRRLPAQEEYLWMSCFGAHMAALFVALDELLPYVPATNQDFTPYLARARNHAEAID
eukprot:jgi/Tetstr1/444696/TSEL_032544.t1